MPKMIRMQGLSKIYRTTHVETSALRDFSLEVDDGEFIAVTGPSGSGKTTFLTIAGLLEEHTDGEYQLDGIDIRSLRDSDRSRLRNEKIGFVFQAFNLIPELDIRENIQVPLRYRRMNATERLRRVDESLERVGLGGRARHYPAELSGGQQQRVAIARALAGSPRLLLADEPTGNLDTEASEGIMDLLRELHRNGATIVMVTHEPKLAARADREIRVVDGRLSQMTDRRQARESGS
jgi:putative ABC transport system ATP-binding protein